MNHTPRFLLVASGILSLAAPRTNAAGPVEKPFVPVSRPPAVQMLVPGFTVRELPVRVNNLNNLVYAPDGRLFALAYDGNVLQLKDTNGDGLEDTATTFFNNDRGQIPASIGMAWASGGLYIASQKRILFLRDKGDGTGELETITSGWVPPARAAGSNLDAIGIAVDASGNIYFGIGCDNYSDAYRINPRTHLPEYNVYGERGTILKVSADGKRRDLISTGLRFPVSLAFNTAGDLFCTDQEGATWLPNGNPFDELLHIQTGRHYGFPPRHPKYLPGVIDEPSVFNYGPQHQSTCGLHFNEPVANSGKTFGPAWWRGDAFVAGESRGKIWRTKLVKSAAGYVAQNQLIACLSMLTIDAVPTPRGDLLVACHTGAPDWGTGPRGQGKVFHISYAEPNAPQPVLAYAASSTETRVVFDRALDPAQWKNLASQSALLMGDYVTAGERFESFTPPYQAVKDQSMIHRYELSVLSGSLAQDRRSITLLSAPRTEAFNYAVTLPEAGRTNRPNDPNRGEVQQHAAIDLVTDLCGTEAMWHDASHGTNWSGWLPHLDLAVAREFTSASEEHSRLFELLKTPGTLTLRGQWDLWLMLRTAIQPGAKLDFEYPIETVTVALKSGAKFDLKTDARARIERTNDHEARVTFDSKQNQWLPFEISLATGEGEPNLEVSWTTVEDIRPRALPLRRILLPWATPRPASSTPSVQERRIPEIAGGDWERGKKIFFSEAAACSRCHQVAGEGGKLGPDLSNLVYRDYASVLRDITQPSAAINPDHIAYTVELKNGESANGVIVDDTPANVVLGQITGGNLAIPKSNVTVIKPSSVSFMPEGLLKSLDAQQQRDLLTFLLTATK